MTQPESEPAQPYNGPVVDPELISPLDLQIFELIGAGKSAADLASTFNFSKSAIQEHKRKIRESLGLEKPELTRPAAQHLTANITLGSIIVQPKVIETIEFIVATHKKMDTRAAISDQPFSTIRNPNVLHYLCHLNYISIRMMKLQKVDLKGLVAVLFLKDEATRPYLTDFQMKGYTREIIEQEVSIALN